MDWLYPILVILALSCAPLFGSCGTISCLQESDCPKPMNCCKGVGAGQCYDPANENCSPCSCGGSCTILPPKVCSKAILGEYASCCVYECINPNTSLCCAYHIPHSSAPNYSVCKLSASTVCCGPYCMDVPSEECCLYESADPQNYKCPKGVVCCGPYGCCKPGQQCSGPNPSLGHCVNSTMN